MSPSRWGDMTPPVGRKLAAWLRSVIARLKRGWR